MQNVFQASFEPIEDTSKTGVSKTDISETLSLVLSENIEPLTKRDYSYLVSRDSDISEHMEIETDLDLESVVWFYKNVSTKLKKKR